MASSLTDKLPTQDEDDEEQLVEKAKRDASALSQLYRRHYAAIELHVRRRVGDGGEADDLVSEVFLNMVKYLPRYRCRGRPFRAWLYRLATTQISRWARKRRGLLMHQLDDAERVAANVETPDGGGPSLKSVRLALLTLPEKYQAVISLHYLERMPLTDVAQILQCPIGTVKSRLSRARDLLRRRLQRGPIDE